MKSKQIRRDILNYKKPKKVGLTVGVFALGATAGSLLALLFAPASGRATRRRLGNQFRQAKRLLAKKAGYLKEAATEKIGETREWLVDRVMNGNGKHPVRHRIAHHA